MIHIQCSVRNGIYDTSFRMQIIFKLKNIENKIEATKESELFTSQGLKSA